MRVAFAVCLLGAGALAFDSPQPLTAAQQARPSYERFLNPPSPQQIVAAKRVDRLAWVDYREGRRNAYTAAAPAFTWTTVPPAKSSAPHLASHPPPHTQCAIGA